MEKKAVGLENALREGRSSAAQLVDGVRSALTTTKSSLQIIGRLETVGRNIEKIVDTVGLVAVFRLPMAFAVSVVLVGSGAGWRRWSRVCVGSSGDIRGLARETSNNVDRIKDTVRSILDQIAALRRDLEQVIASNELEVQNNLAVTSSFERLEKDIAALSTANKGILQGADAILSAIQETSAGAKQIAAAAEEAGAASAQASTASSQQARGAEDLAASIEEIAALAQELK